jgi:hypothetical protein
VSGISPRRRGDFTAENAEIAERKTEKEKKENSY